MLQALIPSAHDAPQAVAGRTYYDRTAFMTVVQSNLCIRYMLFGMSETLVRAGVATRPNGWYDLTCHRVAVGEGWVRSNDGGLRGSAQRLRECL